MNREESQQEKDQRLLTAVKTLAAKGYRHLDADEESKAMKVLSALAGIPGCYPEIDALYAEIEGKSAVGASGVYPNERRRLSGPAESALLESGPSGARGSLPWRSGHS